MPAPAAAVVLAVACLYLPGLAVVGTRSTALPPALARVLASSIVTTVAATALAAAGNFSAGRVAAVVAAAAAVTFVLRRLAATASTSLAESPPPAPSRVLRALGPAVMLAGLAATWPGYPVFLGYSDSTSYLATGVSLARHGALHRKDTLGPSLPRPLREALFDSMSQTLGNQGPPYRRAPGALMLASLDDAQAWPCFFPVPPVWAALFASARVPGFAPPETAATGFAPFFGAMALWAFLVLAWTWLGGLGAFLATGLLGASAPFYMAAHVAMSEPIAAFFVLGGLATVAAASASPSGMGRVDAALAGAAFGAAIFTRVDSALFLALALALAGFLAPRAYDGPGRRPAFLVPVAVGCLLALAEARLIPGSYVDPLTDHAGNALMYFVDQVGPTRAGALLLSSALAGGLALAVLARRFGAARVAGLAVILGVAIGHAAAANFLWERTPMWLSFSVGWSGLALAAAGAAMAFRQRERLPAAPFVLAAAAGAALILFYNPHVHPTLPWGFRRYVPWLLPLLLLLATKAVVDAGRRSRIAGVALAALLVAEVGRGGRPLWGEPLVDGAWEQFQAISAAIPPGGTILVDRGLSPLMLGPALWLLADRENVTTLSTTSPGGRPLLTALVGELAPRGPVYLVAPALADQARTPFVAFQGLTSVDTSLLFLEQTYDRRPETLQRYLQPVIIYRLEPDPDPRGRPIS